MTLWISYACRNFKLGAYVWGETRSLHATEITLKSWLMTLKAGKAQGCDEVLPEVLEAFNGEQIVRKSGVCRGLENFRDQPLSQKVKQIWNALITETSGIGGGCAGGESPQKVLICRKSGQKSGNFVHRHLCSHCVMNETDCRNTSEFDLFLRKKHIKTFSFFGGHTKKFNFLLLCDLQNNVFRGNTLPAHKLSGKFEKILGTPTNIPAVHLWPNIFVPIPKYVYVKYLGKYAAR